MISEHRLSIYTPVISIAMSITGVYIDARNIIAEVFMYSVFPMKWLNMYKLYYVFEYFTQVHHPDVLKSYKELFIDNLTLSLPT